MPRRFGYARISTASQDIRLQRDALLNAGCEAIYVDEGFSGARLERPGLETALGELQSGDTLYVWKLDRLGRSLKHLVKLMESLQARGIGFVSLTEGFDCSTAFGTFTFQILCAVAELEREILRERVLAGLQAARANGSVLGRKPALDADALTEAQLMIRDGFKIDYIADTLNVGRSTLYRHLSDLMFEGASETA